MHIRPDIKIIGFDADDTLWDSEPFYRDLEHEFCDLLQDFMPQEECSRELYKIEVSNMPLYGYGAKAYTLSIIETALRISKNQLPTASVQKIVEAGKKLADSPLQLLDHVETVLQYLASRYKLIVATKGDLLDQERKLKKSKLEPYFHHIEIMSDKQTGDYQKLFQHLDIKAEEFLIVGNSLKSDILPVLELGGYAIHIPYHTTWLHEKMDACDLPQERFIKVESIGQILQDCSWIQNS